MQTDLTVSIKSQAKINLTLEVLGKRPDGYHDLRSFVVPISLYDQIECSPRDSGIHTEMDISGLGYVPDLDICPNGDNLATRAALALQQAAGVTQGADIRISKQIPIGAGLGGGSSNAAATLLALNEMWQCGLSREDLLPLARSIGCDVPALLQGGTVLMEGVGHQLSPLEIPSENAVGGWWLVLINPCFSVSTADIYSRCRPSLTSDSQVYNNMRLALERGDVEGAAKNLRNDLESAASGKYPLIAIMLDSLRDCGTLGAALSGSGATCFGLARSREEAEAIAVCLRDSLGDGFWVRVVQTLPDGVMVAQVTLTHSV